MAIEAGQQLLHYRLIEKIGEGGMGVIWKATDMTLDREVAIKVLPDAFSQDKDRLARFEREAKLLASLNHANIATVHSVHETDGVRFLAMEFVEGDDLAQRLARGAIPVDEALRIAVQIAEALEAAHEAGVIHRDLKPANVKLKPDGTVKVLDFGLAKATQPEATQSDPSQSPTLTAATQPGLIMGTASYMSPEQARGKPVDRRADIWAFGSVLFEMLTGRQPFRGESVTDVLAAVVSREPDWHALPPDTPWRLRDVLESCLEKDVNSRLHAAADARIGLSRAMDEPAYAEGPGPSQPEPVLSTAAWLFVVAAVSLVAGASVWFLTGRANPAGFLTSELKLPDGLKLPEIHYDPLTARTSNPIALSPDGRLLAFTAADDQTQTPEIYLSTGNSFDVTKVPESGATTPFFSPDGNWLGYYRDGQFFKIRVSPGAPGSGEPISFGPAVPIADAPRFSGSGVSWGPDDQIVFSSFGLGGVLMLVDANGGTASALTAVDWERGEYSHTWPQVLPDGKGILFSVWGQEIGGTYIYTFETDAYKEVIPGAYGAEYVPTQHIVYHEGLSNRVLARPFDLETMQPLGPPSPVLNDVWEVARSGRLSFAVGTASGALAYIPGDIARRGLVLMSLDGVETRLNVPPDWYDLPRFHPTRNEILIHRWGDLQRINVTTAVSVSIPTGGYQKQRPIWNHDGNRISFSSNETGGWSLNSMDPDGLRPAVPVLSRINSQFPLSWSPDGGTLLFNERSPDTNDDLYLLEGGGNEPRVLAATEFKEADGVFSRNGDWIAFVSDRTGTDEVYVVPVPGLEPVRQVSASGGVDPVWAPDNSFLYYWERNKLMKVRVTDSGPLRETAQELFTRDYVRSLWTNYDISPDGQHFIMVSEPHRPRSIRRAANWFDELRRLAPTEQ